MDEEALQPYQPEPKISDVEIVAIGLFYVMVDAVDLLPLAGDVTSALVAPMGFYYYMKGINGITFIVSEVIELIPLLQEIPFVRTICWGITIWIDRHPALQAKLGVALQVADVLEGNAEGVEGAERTGAGISASEAGAASTTGAAGSQTLDMTEVAPGGAAPTGEAGAERGGQPSKDRNARPSETTTERDTTQPGARKEEGGDEQGQPEETEEERRKREKEEEYEKMMRTKSETPPMEQAQQELFSEQGPPPVPKPKPLSMVGGRPVPQESESAQREKQNSAKGKETRDQFGKLKTPQRAPVVGGEGDDEDDQELPMAA